MSVRHRRTNSVSVPSSIQTYFEQKSKSTEDRETEEEVVTDKEELSLEETLPTISPPPPPPPLPPLPRPPSEIPVMKTPRRGMVFDSTETNAQLLYRELVLFLIDNVSRSIHVYPPITKYGVTIFPLGGDVMSNAEEIVKILCCPVEDGGMGTNWEFEVVPHGIVIPSSEGPEGLTREIKDCPVLKRYAKSIRPLKIAGKYFVYAGNSLFCFLILLSLLGIVYIWADELGVGKWLF